MFAELFTALALFAPIPEPVQLADAASSCRYQRTAVIVRLDPDAHYPVLRHIRRAVRRGHPRLLHLERTQAPERRRAALRGVPPKEGFDRDEYPPAASFEGGAGASVEYIRSSVNRSAGAVFGNRMRPFCNGQRFRFRLRR